MRSRLGIAIATIVVALMLPAITWADPATLDPGFGSGGFATLATGHTESQATPIVQSSGRTVVFGLHWPADWAALVVFTVDMLRHARAGSPRPEQDTVQAGL